MAIGVICASLVIGLGSKWTMVSGTIRVPALPLIPAKSELTIQVGDHQSQLSLRLQNEAKQIPFSIPIEFDIEQKEVVIEASIKIGDKVAFGNQKHLKFATDLTRLEIVLTPYVPLSDSLEGTKWLLVSINGEKLSFEGRRPFVSFGAKGELGGYSGVNSFGGLYTLTDRKLGIELGPMTLMAGPPASMEIETKITANLPKVNRYEIVNGKLRLCADDQVLFEFERSTSKAI